MSTKYTNMRGTKFNSRDMEMSRLQGTFEDCEFILCDLRWADFSDVTFKGCDFKMCDLTGTDLENTSFVGCRFLGCTGRWLEFEDVEFTDSSIEKCLFWQCTGDLPEGDWHMTEMEE